MAKEEQKSEKKEEPKEIELVQVPTQHSLAYQYPDGTVISTEELLARIANDVAKIRKSVA